MTAGISRSTGMFAFCSAVAMLMGSAAVAHADGINSGGSCCADLEERVAELEATTARKGNRRVSLTISGQVHTNVMAWDNGDRSDVYVGDLANVGGTYFQFNGAAKISPTLSAGYIIQIGLDKGSRNHQFTEVDDDGGQAGDTTMVMTLANWYLDHKQIGRLTVGRITTATAGITGIDLGGASAAANVNVGYWQRSFAAVGTGYNWDTLLGGGTVNGSTLSRANAISYTSPTLGGFSVQAAWGENDLWDASLRYAGEFSGFRVAAGVGYASNLGGVNEVIADIPDNAGKDSPALWKGSASILHVQSGLFVNGAFVNQMNDHVPGADDSTLRYVQGGIAKNWTGLGNTVIYGEYAKAENGAVDTDSFTKGVQVGYASANVWGIGVVQHIDAAAMELFLAYRHYEGDAPSLTFDTDAKADGLQKGVKGAGSSEFDAVMGGARIKF